MNQERKFEGIWVPKALWFNPDLRPVEKLIALEVHSLDKTDKHCFAGNDHFAELFGLGVATVTRTIKALEEKSIIKTTTKPSKTGTKRTIQSLLSEWLNKQSCLSKRLSADNQSDLPLNRNQDNKRDRVLSQATSGEVTAEADEDTSFAEGEFSLGEDPAEKNNTIFSWVKELSEDARAQSLTDKASQPFSIPRNLKAKYLKKVQDYLFQLQNGSFLEKNKFDSGFMQHVDSEAVEALHGLSEEAVKKGVKAAIDNYLLARNNPDKYSFISRDRKIDLGAFFYEFNENNGVLGVSHFLQYFGVELKDKNGMETKELMLQAVYKKDLPKMYHAVYNQYEDFPEEEKLRAIKSILSLCRWWKRNESRLINIYRGRLGILFPDGMSTFIEYYLGNYIKEKRFQHPISLYPEKKHWGDFCDWLFKGYDIDLEAEEKIEKKKKDTEITSEEIQERMDAE
jgi:hypothetical protein